MLLKTPFFELALFNRFWEGLGRVWGGFWEGFGRGLEPLGVSWVTFWRHFLKLVFRTLTERALGGFWAPLALHFEGSGRGLGRILGGFWENLRAIWRVKN